MCARSYKLDSKWTQSRDQKRTKFVSAIQFAQALCNRDSLDVMRERFAALVSVAGRLIPDSAVAEEIGRHYLILDALYKTLIIQSVEVVGPGQRGNSEAAERLLNGALKVQRAAMACVSALRVLRDASPSPAPTTTATLAPESDAVGVGSSLEALTLLGNSN